MATDLGATRHIAVAKNGDIYAKLSKLKDGKDICLLRDTNKDGIIDETNLFGDYLGTGVFINDDYLYTSSNSGVYRYKMNAKGEVIDYEKPALIVSGLVDRKRDNAKPTVIILDNARIHTAHKIKERIKFWQKRGPEAALYIKDYHLLRPILQTFLDAIYGNLAVLIPTDKQAMQNTGY